MNYITDLLSIVKADFQQTDKILCRTFVLIVRLRHYFYEQFQVIVLKRVFSFIIDIFYIIYVKFIHNSDIARKVYIGEGLRIVHPYNIIIADGVIIGKNCKILHEVTIGYSSRRNISGVPKIGNNVQINAGAKIFGPITVGDNVKIGANAVVYEDIPNNSTVYNLVKVRSYKK